jgi:hypothetical protein
MGKTPDPIWNHWSDFPTGKVTCKYCKKNTQLKHATKCKTHTAGCQFTPYEVRQELKSELNQKHIEKKNAMREEKDRSQSYRPPILEDPNDTVAVSSEDAEGSTVSIIGTKRKINCLEDAMVKISRTTHKDLEVLLTKAMISGNVSFNWVNNFHLQKFFEKLGGGFHPPTRKEISGSILNKLDQQSSDALKEAIGQAKNISIVPDGWQNVRGSSVVGVMLANTTKTIFYKSFETG